MYRFYREKLPGKEKFIYDLLLTSFERQEIEIKVPLLDEEKIKQIFKYVLYDNPLIFHVEGLITKKKILSSRISLYPKYNYSKEEIELLTKACLTKAKNILEYGKNFSEYDYEILIHDLFCRKIKYHNDGKDSFNIVGALLNKRAVCSGIAKATKFLMDLKNIKCIFIEGTYNDGTRTEKHAWNKVQINGNWYNLDVTQDISFSTCGAIRYDCFNFKNKQDSSYNLISDECFPKCNSSFDSYYERNNLIFDKEEQLHQLIEMAILKGKKYCTFKWMRGADAFYYSFNNIVAKIQTHKFIKYDLFFNEDSCVGSIVFY